MGRTFSIRPTTKPRWFQSRKLLATWLVRLARRIEPKNEEVTAFYMDLMMDQMIAGQAVVRVDPWDVEKTEQT